MIPITDVLHELVRRGLSLRIETDGTLFIYDPQRRAALDADAAFDAYPPAAEVAYRMQRRTERPGPHDAACGAGSPPQARDTPQTPERPAQAGACAASPQAAATGAPASHATPHAPTAPPEGSTADPAQPAEACNARRAKKKGKPDGMPLRAPAAATKTAATSAGASATAGGAVVVLPDFDGSFTPTGALWRGITWQDVPGHDDPVKKLNFALLKRGMLRGYKACARLHGEALRQHLLRLQDRSTRNRGISAQRHEELRLRSQARRQNAQCARKIPPPLPP